MDAICSPGGAGEFVNSHLKQLDLLNMPQKFILIFVGEAAALGLAVDIPILIRSLADSLSIGSSGPSLRFHDSILAALDNGLHADDPCALVPDYGCAWWNDHTAPGVNDIMSSKTLPGLLAVHGTNRAISDIPVHVSAPLRAEPTCSQCRKYRDLTAEAVAELQGVLQYAEAMKVSAEATLDADTRRAQGFFLLHEAIQHKEMQETKTATVAPPRKEDLVPATIDGVTVNRRSQRVQATASAELQRLQRLPTGSYKWTWGPELSEVEAIHLLAPPGEPSPPHSGYDVSLPSGNWMRFPESTRPSMPNQTSNRFSPLSSNHEIPPLTTSIPSIEAQRSNHGADVAATPGVEGQGTVVNPEAVSADNMAANAGMHSASTRPSVPNVSLAVSNVVIAGHGNKGKGREIDDNSDFYVSDFYLPDSEVSAVPENLPGGGDTQPVNAESDDDAEMDPPNGRLGRESSLMDVAAAWLEFPDAEEADKTMGPGPTDAGESPEGDTDANPAIGDIASMWGDAGNMSANKAEPDHHDSVGDLAQMWGTFDNADDQHPNDTQVHSGELVRDLASMWGKLDDADDQPVDEAVADPENSVEDLATQWGMYDDAEGEAQAEGGSDRSVGDLALRWGKMDDAGMESPSEAVASRSMDADANVDPNAEGRPVPDPTTGLTEVSPTRLTLTAQHIFTAGDFAYFDPAWLESDQEEDSDDGTNQGQNSEDENRDNGSDDQGDSDAEDDGEAA